MRVPGQRPVLVRDRRLSSAASATGTGESPVASLYGVPFFSSGPVSSSHCFSLEPMAHYAGKHLCLSNHGPMDEGQLSIYRSG